MLTYRGTVMAVLTCAAGLSLAACSAGITTAKPPESHSRTSSRAGSSPIASSSHSPSRSPSPSASASPVATVHVNAPIGSFPIPPGARVIANMSCPKQILLGMSPVTPSRASAFYTAALPAAGYKISSNIQTGSSENVTLIGFSGHGYTGSISAAADLNAAGVPASIPDTSGFSKNSAVIELSLPGVSDSYTCPGP